MKEEMTSGGVQCPDCNVEMDMKSRCAPRHNREGQVVGERVVHQHQCPECHRIAEVGR